MKNPLNVLLALALVVVSAFAYWQTTALLSQRKELDSVLAAKSASDNLDLQAKCSKQAPETVQHFGWKEGDGVLYFLSHTNHFNRQLGRCIVTAQISDPVAGQEGRAHYFRLLVVDAFEFTTYGEFVELVDLGAPGKNVTGWTKTCKVTLPGGESKVCKSQPEFEQLIKVYLEG